MKKMQIIQYALMGLCMLLYSCPWDAGGNSTKQDLTERPIKARTFDPYTMMRNILTVQGSITKGTIAIISETTVSSPIVQKIINQFFTENATNGFNIKLVDDFLDIYKTDDIYIEETERRYVTSSKIDDLSELLQRYTLTPSSDFQGTMHIFLNFTFLYKCGLPDGSCDVRRVVIYGPELATALNNNKPPITHMGKNNTYPVGARAPVVIDHTAEPDSVRKLMQAAKDTKDPRLLVIERTGSTGKVSITAFGETETIDAGTPYEWKFGEAQLKELRKFVVKR